MDGRSRRLIEKTIRQAQGPSRNEIIKREGDIRRLKEQVIKLEQQLAQTNAASLLILGEDLSNMKRDIGQIKGALKNK